MSEQLEIGKDYGFVFGFEYYPRMKMIYRGDGNWDFVNGISVSSGSKTKVTREVLKYLKSTTSGGKEV